jgi:hypothetical protein|tara:strand:+ start:332 stop:538 length:207 start_codon:yes stop_codon:yes gene_type:complete
MKEMKLHEAIVKGQHFRYFYDRHQRLWTLWICDEKGERIEHDEMDNPIECEYFINIEEVKTYFLNLRS